jgi:hypothetical protein
MNTPAATRKLRVGPMPLAMAPCEVPAQNGKRRRKQRKDGSALSLVILLARRDMPGRDARIF